MPWCLDWIFWGICIFSLDYFYWTRYYWKVSIYWKNIHKATVGQHLLFWQQVVLPKSFKHSSNLRMPFFFIQTSIKHWYLSWSVSNANSFSFLIEQYFTDIIKSLLKLFQGFWDLYLILDTLKYFLSYQYFGLVFR